MYPRTHRGSSGLLLRDDKFPEPPMEESVARQGIRRWRSRERRKMVDTIELLIDQARRLPLSQYTRHAERAKWTRLAGQLIWYKDQILRQMSWEALEQDVTRVNRMLYESERREKQRARSAPAPWALKVIEKKPDETESGESENASKEKAA